MSKNKNKKSAPKVDKRAAKKRNDARFSYTAAAILVLIVIAFALYLLLRPAPESPEPIPEFDPTFSDSELLEEDPTITPPPVITPPAITAEPDTASGSDIILTPVDPPKN